MSYFQNPPFGGAFSRFLSAPAATPSSQTSILSQRIVALNDPQIREEALQELSMDRGDDLAPMLWNSCGTMAILLQEVLRLYPLVLSTDLTDRASRRACNALALFQRLASHPDTRMKFLKAEIPMYVYPYLGTMLKDTPHEWLRANSLSVIGALVKDDDSEVVHYLLASQIFPYCLNSIDVGSELSKSVATVIILKLITQKEGLKYCCTVAERFYAIARALANMVEKIVANTTENSPKLLKNIIQCYLKLSQDPRGCDALQRCLPQRFRDNALIYLVQDDPRIMGYLQQIFNNVAKGSLLSMNPQPFEGMLGRMIVGQSQ